MILSHHQIEDIGAAVIQDFNKFFYCQHNSIVVYEDTRGHIETKCKKCGKVTVFDVLSMRKIVFRLRPKEN